MLTFIWIMLAIAAWCAREGFQYYDRVMAQPDLYTNDIA